jgi:hypothetical protein
MDRVNPSQLMPLAGFNHHNRASLKWHMLTFDKKLRSPFQHNVVLVVRVIVIYVARRYLFKNRSHADLNRRSVPMSTKEVAFLPLIDFHPTIPLWWLGTT